MIWLILAVVAAYLFVGFGVYDVADEHGDHFPVKLFTAIAWIIFSMYVLGRMLCVGIKRWKGFEERLAKEEESE